MEIRFCLLGSLFLLGMGILLNGCGQKGPLYQPDHPKPYCACELLHQVKQKEKL